MKREDKEEIIDALENKADIRDLVKPIFLKTKKRKSNLVIGGFSDINGKDSIPLKNVKPTKAEILAIIRYHAKLLRSVDGSFAMGMSGSWEIRQMPYSNDRINYYSKFVSKKEIEEIFEEVYKGFKK